MIVIELFYIIASEFHRTIFFFFSGFNTSCDFPENYFEQFTYASQCFHLKLGCLVYLPLHEHISAICYQCNIYCGGIWEKVEEIGMEEAGVEGKFYYFN